MYVVASLISNKGNNFGGSGRYINYMAKETNGVVFDSKGNEILADKAIELIDKHSCGGIRRNESRWYSPVYSLSEDEAKHVANGILSYGNCESRNIKCFDDLTFKEKKRYNLKVRELAIEFQNEMVQNFNKQNLGIKTKDDILWYGVVENKRHYTGYDSEVLKKKVKQGQNKTGFNTHIHIIQSRKALNEKKSLVSPMANARVITKQGAGFDRNLFYNKVEQSFDNQTGYKRNQTNTFEYYKAQTKTEGYWQKQGYFQNSTTVENKKPKYPKNFKKHVDKSIITNSRCVNYFFYLEKRGLLEFEKKQGSNYYFKKKGQRTGSISVSDKGWKDFSTDESGGIIKAIQLWDQFDWSQSLSLIKSLSNEYSDDRELQIKRKLELVQELKNNNLINYINKRGINFNLAKKYLKEVHYSTEGKINYSIGFKNNSEGYVLRSEGFKSNLGNQNITTINFDTSIKSKVLVFEGFFNYLSYLEIYGKIDDKTIILNSTGNFNMLKTFLNNQDHKHMLYYYGDNDTAGNRLFQKIKNEKFKIKDKRYLYNSYTDLNQYITSKTKIVTDSKLQNNIEEATLEREKIKRKER